jgi:hypothetical protein
MKRTLHKTESGWHVINMQATLNGPLLQSLPILDHGYVNGPGLSDSDEGQEVEFEIIDFPVPPTNGPVSNSISKYAKLVDKATRPLTEDDAWLTIKEGDITVNFKPMPEFDEPAYPTRLDQLREQGWLEINKAFSKYWTEYTDGDFSHFTAVEKAQRKIGWLKENYNPPTKKQRDE